MICCADSTFIGCFSACSDIDTGLVATQTGVHTIYIYFNQVRFVFTESVNLGENIIITGRVPEKYTFDMAIKNPDGSDYVSLGKSCFTFKTVIDV